MRELLYIRLQSDAADAVTTYCISRPDALSSFDIGHAPLADVLALAANRRIIVLTPGAEVRLTRVTVPGRQTAAILKATPYALEDQMAEDVDTLHFALGPRQADGSNPVAVVARARMEQWLAPFRERGLRPEALIPETLSLPPVQEGYWSALAEPGHITVRTDAYAGFGCVTGDLPLFLELADSNRQATLRLIVLKGAEDDFSQVQWPLQLLPGFSEPLEALLQNLRLDSCINLLQGSYSQREGLKRLWLPWRTAAILAGIWVAVAGIAYSAQTLRLQHQSNAQTALNVQRYQQLFPNQTRIVDLQAQVEQQMKLLQGNGAHGGFLALLDTLSEALTATHGLTLQSLQYREGAIYASLTGTDLQQLETLRSWFAKSSKVHLEVQSANSGTDGAQIRVKLTPPT